MAVKTTGSEFNRFYSDKEFWPDSHNIWHEDECITVDGVIVDGDFDLTAVPDESRMTIDGGCVMDEKNPDKEQSFEGYFKKWRKKQSTAVLIIECGKDRLDHVVEAIKAAGGKIVKE